MRCERGFSAVLVVIVAASACAGSSEPPPRGPDGPPVVRPGAPGDTTRIVDPDDLGAAPAPTGSDVAFMQGMVVHHAQALAMSALVEDRTLRTEVGHLGRRVALSQADEIEMMRQWLERHGAPVPPVSMAEEAARVVPGDLPTHMPGMLSDSEMDRLASATGDEFDRLFLAAMILHHRGALVMVEQLFDDPQAGQEDEIFQFATHVASDQTVEIARMQRMLNALMVGTP